MLYIFGVSHFYQKEDRPPSGMEWRKHIFDFCPELCERYSDMCEKFARDENLTDDDIIGDTNNIWVNCLEKKWHKEYVHKLESLIKEKEITLIFEEASGSRESDPSLTEKLASDLGINYHNIEPPEKDRPYSYEESIKDIDKHKAVNQWREPKWVEIVSENYKDQSKNALLIVGEYHRQNKFYLGKGPYRTYTIEKNSMRELLKKNRIKIEDIPEREFWNDKPCYSKILESSY